jgi:hypothetical protein
VILEACLLNNQSYSLTNHQVEGTWRYGMCSG